VLDVVVVGGGPGGLYCAWSLASRGFHVALVEEHPIAGQPVHCTGIIAPDAFREFSIPADAILNELHTVRFYSPSGKQFHYSPPTVEAVVIDRAQFDHRLYTMAKDAAVEVLLEWRVNRIEIDGKAVRVQCERDEKTILARACVLATGASYALHRQLGLEFPPLYLNSAQVEIPAGLARDVEIHFGSYYAPQGFAWVVPVDRDTRRFARVGVMCSTNAEGAFRRFLEGIAEEWQLDSMYDLAPRKRMLPLAPISRTYGDRLLVVGDAAGLVKPTTGGGIYFSLVTAAIAAELMAEALAKDRLSSLYLSEYEQRWRQQLGSEVRIQLLFRLISERLDDAEIDEFFDLARTEGLLSLIRNTARFNRHHDLIRALFRYPAARKILLRQIVTSMVV
jgi:geranylgeranyl reductase family protein